MWSRVASRWERLRLWVVVTSEGRAIEGSSISLSRAAMAASKPRPLGEGGYR